MDSQLGFLSHLDGMGPTGIVISVVSLAVLYKIFFKGWDDFKECIVAWIDLTGIAERRDDMLEDSWWSRIKVICWMGVSVGVGYLVQQAVA